MALPCPGPSQISLADLQTEFGGSNPIGLDEYYRNGAYVPSNNTNVPTSGTIGLNNFFCAVNEIIRYITVTSTNVNASSYFTAGEWSSAAPKRLVVNSGVIVGATSTGNYALTIPSGFGGSFRLDNNGSILGAGGAANSGTGGNAIFAGAPISIFNANSIRAGGGGGGRGGTGGPGVCRETTRVQSGCQQGDTARCPGGWNQYASGNWCCQWRRGCAANIWWKECERYIYTSGGAGGAGGRGEGYDGAAAAGVGGSGGGGCGAGTGGTGGSGGGYGQIGGTGNTGFGGSAGGGSGGAGGGQPGFYIVNNGNVTWLSTGARSGRVG